MWLLIAIVFMAGFGWGQWFEAWNHKRIIAKRDESKLTVSMPVKADDAAQVMALLKELVEEAERMKLIESGDSSETNDAEL